MKRARLTLSALMWVLVVPALYAAPVQPPGQPQARPGVNANPMGSPIRRINPNSRQGTVPSNRARPEASQGRPPTLENGGVGNGQRFPAPASTPGQPSEQR